MGAESDCWVVSAPIGALAARGASAPRARQARAAISASTPQRELPRLSRIVRVQLLSTQVTGT